MQKAMLEDKLKKKIIRGYIKNTIRFYEIKLSEYNASTENDSIKIVQDAKRTEIESFKKNQEVLYTLLFE